jgi:hypothetical protein
MNAQLAVPTLKLVRRTENLTAPAREESRGAVRCGGFRAGQRKVLCIQCSGSLQQVISPCNLKAPRHCGSGNSFQSEPVGAHCE